MTCPGCGDEFEPTRSDAKWCSDRCRQRGHRAADPAEAEAAAGRPVSGLVEATRRELVRLNKIDSILGEQALAVAGAMASGRDTGSVVASLSRELSRLMDALGSGKSQGAADVPVDPVDEVRKRRVEKESRAREASG